MTSLTLSFIGLVSPLKRRATISPSKPFIGIRHAARAFQGIEGGIRRFRHLAETAYQHCVQSLTQWETLTLMDNKAQVPIAQAEETACIAQAVASTQQPDPVTEFATGEYLLSPTETLPPDLPGDLPPDAETKEIMQSAHKQGLATKEQMKMIIPWTELSQFHGAKVVAQTAKDKNLFAKAESGLYTFKFLFVFLAAVASEAIIFTSIFQLLYKLDGWESYLTGIGTALACSTVLAFILTKSVKKYLRDSPEDKSLYFSIILGVLVVGLILLIGSLGAVNSYEVSQSANVQTSIILNEEIIQLSEENKTLNDPEIARDIETKKEELKTLNHKILHPPVWAEKLRGWALCLSSIVFIALSALCGAIGFSLLAARKYYRRYEKYLKKYEKYTDKYRRQLRSLYSLYELYMRLCYVTGFFIYLDHNLKKKENKSTSSSTQSKPRPQHQHNGSPQPKYSI